MTRWDSTRPRCYYYHICELLHLS